MKYIALSAARASRRGWIRSSPMYKSELDGGNSTSMIISFLDSVPRHVDSAKSVPKVAVIEDEEIQRACLLSALSRAGCSVWGVDSAENFYREALIAKADIVIADIGLPGEDGLSLIGHLTKSEEVGLICITGDGDPDTEPIARRDGAHYFFRKPLDINQVVFAVHLLWQQMNSQRGNSGASQRPWVLDVVNSSLTSPEGATVPLSQNELRFLKILAETPMELVPNSTITRLMYNCDMDDKHCLEMLINRLKQKCRQSNIPYPLRSIFGKGRVFSESIVCVGTAMLGRRRGT